MRASLVEDAGVDLVAEHGHVGPAFEPLDEALDLLPRVDPARRVRRAVEDDQARAFVDLAEHLVGVEREAVGFVQFDRNGRSPGEANHRLVDGEAGVGIHDLRAGLPQK